MVRDQNDSMSQCVIFHGQVEIKCTKYNKHKRTRLYQRARILSYCNIHVHVFGAFCFNSSANTLSQFNRAPSGLFLWCSIFIFTQRSQQVSYNQICDSVNYYKSQVIHRWVPFLKTVKAISALPLK